MRYVPECYEPNWEPLPLDPTDNTTRNLTWEFKQPMLHRMAIYGIDYRLNEDGLFIRGPVAWGWLNDVGTGLQGQDGLVNAVSKSIGDVILSRRGVTLW